MKKLLILAIMVSSIACGNGNSGAKVDSSNVITDSTALNSDTTSVMGGSSGRYNNLKTDTLSLSLRAGK